MKEIDLSLCCCFIVFVVLSSRICAHEEVSFKFAPDEKRLVSSDKDMKIPAEFQPIEFHRAKNLIRIGNHRMKLIPYFQSLFPKDGKYAIHFSASWYHDPNLLPPYLIVRIEPEGRQFKYELVLNLRDLSVVHFEVVVELDKNAIRYFPVDLSARMKEIKESVSVVEKNAQERGDIDPFADDSEGE